MDYFNAFYGVAPLGDADSDDISKYENQPCKTDADCGTTIFLECTNLKCKHKNIMPI
jgi:uncharacterized membrane protein YfcA